MGQPYDRLLDSCTEQSPVITLAGGAAVIDLPFPAAYRHSFAGIEYFSDAEATLPVVPTAGTETYLLTTTVKPSSEQSFSSNVINSADETQVDFAANVTTVKCTLAAVAGNGAAYVIMRVTGNIS